MLKHKKLYTLSALLFFLNISYSMAEIYDCTAPNGDLQMQNYPCDQKGNVMLKEHREEQEAIEKAEKYLDEPLYQTDSPNTLKRDYFACLTEDYLSQIHTAKYKSDVSAMSFLLNSRCIITKGGTRITVLESGWGTIKVRAYGENGSLVLYTDREAINR